MRSHPVLTLASEAGSPEPLRARRERLRAELRAGSVNAIDVLLDPPAWMRTIVIGDVLCWAGIDEGSCVRILDACALNWGRRTEQLVEREVWRVFEAVALVAPLVWRRWRRAQQRPVVAA